MAKLRDENGKSNYLTRDRNWIVKKIRVTEKMKSVF